MLVCKCAFLNQIFSSELRINSWLFLIQRLTLQQMSQKKIKLTEINIENAWIYTYMYSLRTLVNITFKMSKMNHVKQINCVWWKADLQIYSFVLLKTLSTCLCLVFS